MARDSRRYPYKVFKWPLRAVHVVELELPFQRAVNAVPATATVQYDSENLSRLIFLVASRMACACALLRKETTQ